MVSAWVDACLSGGPSTPLQQCPNINVSVCASCQTLPLVVVAYNPLAQPVQTVLRVPSPRSAVAVVDANGTTVVSQVTPSDDYDVFNLYRC